MMNNQQIADAAFRLCELRGGIKDGRAPKAALDNAVALIRQHTDIQEAIDSAMIEPNPLERPLEWDSGDGGGEKG